MKLKVTVWSCLAIWACGALHLAAAGAGATAPSVDEHAIAALVTQLGSDQFEQREAATAQLEAMGLPAYRAVRTARQTANDPETKARLAAVEFSLSRLTFWNGAESIADYAKRMGIKETEKTIFLGEKRVPLKLVLIPAGEFVMGSPAGEDGRLDDERLHRVSITSSYMAGTTPITEAQWKAIMGTDPSAFKGDDMPVEWITWKDSTAFCEALSKETNDHFRLPTEAEWEYACRAGTSSAFSFGPKIDCTMENYKDGEAWQGAGPPQYRLMTTPVQMFKPNAWGLYDIHGNVLQWCSDWYAPYPEGESVNPIGPETGTLHVMRGGSWESAWNWCRSAKRETGEPDRKTVYVGMRVVMDLKDP